MNSYIKKLLFLGIILLFSACAKTGVTHVQKNNNYNQINETSIAFVKNNFGIYTSKCKKKVNDTYKYLSKNHNVDLELIARDVNIISIEDNPKFITKLGMMRYDTNDANGSCSASEIFFIVQIEDIEHITKNWTGKLNSKKVNAIFRNENPKIVWKGRVRLILKDKTTLNDFSKVLMTELDKHNVFPKKSRSIEESKEIQYKKKIQNIKKELLTCNSLNPLDIKYNKRFNVLCIGKLGLANALETRINVNEKDVVLTSSTSIKKYKTLDNECSEVRYNSVGENSNISNISFKSSYLNQILKKYNNNCKIKKVNSLNYITCNDINSTDYFIEQSLKDKKNRIFNKKILTVNQQCFSKLQKINTSGTSNNLNQKINVKKDFNYSSDELREIDFKTVAKNDFQNFDFYNGSRDLIKEDGKLYLVFTKNYGLKNKPTKVEKYYFYLEEAKNYNLINGKFIFSKKIVKIYNKNGYDEEGYNYKGFNKEGFNKLGRDINGLDKKGLNKFGWNPKLRIYGKQVFNKDGYDQKGYDKNGYNKDGYDRDGWNPKLKKFKNK